jgi:hypothetical protein
MISGYILERQNGIFDLYLGDDVEGDLHFVWRRDKTIRACFFAG